MYVSIFFSWRSDRDIAFNHQRWFDKIVHFYQAPIVRFFYHIVIWSNWMLTHEESFYLDLLCHFSRFIQLCSFGRLFSVVYYLWSWEFWNRKMWNYCSYMDMEFDYWRSAYREMKWLKWGKYWYRFSSI
jgi:hypothetical protein